MLMPSVTCCNAECIGMPCNAMWWYATALFANVLTSARAQATGNWGCNLCANMCICFIKRKVMLFYFCMCLHVYSHLYIWRYNCKWILSNVELDLPWLPQHTHFFFPCLAQVGSILRFAPHPAILGCKQVGTRRNFRSHLRPHTSGQDYGLHSGCRRSTWSCTWIFMANNT